MAAAVASASIASAPFLLVALATILVLQVERARRHRAALLTIASAVFAVLSVASPLDAVCLAAMGLSGWIFIRFIAVRRDARFLAFAVVAIVAEFVATRLLVPGIPWLPGVALGRTVGLSYIMFRIIHMIVDAHGGELPRPVRGRDYVCFLLFFPTFLAGPIARFQDFHEALSQPAAAPIGNGLFGELFAILLGYFKFIVLAGVFFAGFTVGAQAPDAPHHAIAFVCFAAYLYASFSGYSDAARGIGGLLGFRLPENFDRPLISSDFLDLWSRWHISLSDWFKLYLFNPLTKALIAKVDRPPLVPYLGAIGFFATFFVMGLWHGISLRFAFYGLSLGAGVSANRLYQTAIIRRLGRRRYAALAQRRLYATAARALALSYFVLALGFFWMQVPPVFVAGVEEAGLVFLLMLALAAAVDRGAMIARHLPPMPALRPLLWAMIAASVIAYLVLQRSIRPLIYQFF